MSLYEFVDEPSGLRAPVLVVAFDGWVDAGAAASTAAATIAAGGRTIASFDSDALLDYRTRRPILDVVDGRPKHLAWQELEVSLVDTHERDVVVIGGPEPDHRWKEFATSVLDLALRIGAIELVALGAIPAAVPHTRPVPLIASATPPDRLEPGDRAPEGLLRVPAAALSVVQMRFAEAGVPTVGFFAQIPHYVTAAYSPAALAIVERVGRHVDIRFATDALATEARTQREQLEAIVDSRPEIKEHVERLESLVGDAGLAAGGRIPSGDEIAAEVEKFLRRAREDEG